MSKVLQQILDGSILVVVSPRVPSPARSTGEGTRDGTRIEEVKQQVFSEQLLKPLAAVKSRIRRLMITYATPLESVNAWLCPKSRWDYVQSAIDQAEKEWDDVVAQACARLSDDIDHLCEENPTQEQAIRQHALTATDFKKATKLVRAAYQLSMAQMVESKSLAEELSQIAVQVVEDLGKMIKDSKRALGGNSYDAANTVPFLEDLTEKTKSFAFADPALARLALQLQQVVGVLPRVGKMIGDQAKLVSAVYERIMEPALAVSDGLEVGALVNQCKSPPKPVQAVQAVVASPKPLKTTKAAQPTARPAATKPMSKPTRPDVSAFTAQHSNPVCI